MTRSSLQAMTVFISFYACHLVSIITINSSRFLHLGNARVVEIGSVKMRKFIEKKKTIHSKVQKATYIRENKQTWVKGP